ncbi:hypothetical protein c7_R850 [Megavirus courdo7]|uniref:Uncharacterized protein n=1 Tax=Megavirus courdo7 TaxID=1128135 RepID=H2EBZ0_9VIRU|nr:hypothetical protein c7_R850 [Megavirus courdo7]
MTSVFPDCISATVTISLCFINFLKIFEQHDIIFLL